MLRANSRRGLVSAQSRVNSRLEPQAVSETLEQGDETRAIVLADIGEQFLLLLIGDPSGAWEQVVGGRGEMDGVGTPVSWMAAAFNESTLLELIDDAHHRVAVKAHGVGELLLGTPLTVDQMHQQPEVARPQAQMLQSVRELVRAVGAELGEQEACPAGERGTERMLWSFGHAEILTGQ
jgi:hypothetical protein